MKEVYVPVFRKHRVFSIARGIKATLGLEAGIGRSGQGAPARARRSRPVRRRPVRKYRDGARVAVSIGMPVYNGERYIRQALASLLAQDFTDFELIVSDDASTDATREICLEYAAKDSRVHYHRNETNLGLMRNFDQVFEMSSGEYFMWAAQDDLWEPGFISGCLEALKENPRAVLCYTKAQFIAPDGSHIEFPLPGFDTTGLDVVSRFNVVLWGISYPHQLYGLVRSRALRHTRLSQDTLGTDLVLLSELSLLGEFAYVPKLLFHIRRPKPDPADWLDQVRAFTRKIDRPVTTKLSALRWYGEMLYYYLEAVNAHARNPRIKVVLGLSVLFGVGIKYNWLLKTLLELSSRERDEGK